MGFIVCQDIFGLVMVWWSALTMLSVTLGDFGEVELRASGGSISAFWRSSDWATHSYPDLPRLW